MRRLVIVACGRAKTWGRDRRAGPTLARDAYVSPYFRDNRRYAEAFGDRWLILSAKYGFIEPEFVIPGPYEVTFKRLATKPISAEHLAAQARAKRLSAYDLVEVLGGAEYVERVRAAFDGTGASIGAPLQGLSLGKGWQAVQRRLKAGRPFGK